MRGIEFAFSYSDSTDLFAVDFSYFKPLFLRFFSPFLLGIFTEINLFRRRGRCRMNCPFFRFSNMGSCDRTTVLVCFQRL